MATPKNPITNIESYLIEAFCSNHMLEKFQPFLQKLSLYGLIDPPDAETAEMYKSELESLWVQAISVYEKELTPRLNLARQQDVKYQINSDQIINQIAACTEVTQFEYYEQAITTILHRINDRYLTQL